MLLRYQIFLVLLASSITVCAQDDFKQRNFSSSGGNIAQDDSHKLFSVIGQPVVRTSLDRPESQAGFIQVIDIIIDDMTAPLIEYSGGSQNINKQNPPTITASITDNIFVASAKIHYRQITSKDWNEAELVSGEGNNYSKNVEGSWFDAIGMEYWLEASDATSNTTRVPASGSYYAYTTSNTELIPNNIFGFGSEVNNYKIISFPYTTSNNSVTSLFEELGPYSDTQWRMATYDAQAEEFREYPSFTQLNRGEGYWFLAKTPTDISVGPVEAPRENRGDLFSITLQAGWNLIGNPYPVSIRWDDVLAINNDNPRLNDLITFNNGFGPGNTLAPFTGGYVYIEPGSAFDILIPFSGQTVLGGRIEDDEFSSDISSESWVVGLNVEQNGTVNSLGGFGMHEKADVEKDPFDQLNPPQFFDFPEIGFDHPSHPLGKFGRDIIPTQPEASWSFEVLGIPENPISLHWENDFGDNNLEIFLLDVHNSQVINMREVNEYNFSLDANHTFQVFYGEDIKKNIIPQEVKISPPYPNPVDKGESLIFRLALPEASGTYSVHIEMLDMSGKTVSTYSTTLNKGIEELSIQTENFPHTKGLYFYKVFVKSNGSSQLSTGKIHIR